MLSLISIIKIRQARQWLFKNDIDLAGLTYLSMCIISLGDSKSFCEDEGVEVLHSNENT
jgi:hypothetical protein